MGAHIRRAGMGKMMSVRKAEIEPRPEFQPLYLQIKQLLIQRVLSGEWRPAQLLPSEMKLAEEYNVSQGTVRKAIEEMAAENLVVRQQGKGTFVATHRSSVRPYRFIRLKSDASDEAHPTTKFVSIKTGIAIPIERERLGLPVGDRVLRTERLRSFAGRDCILERIVLRLDRFPGLEEILDRLRPGSIYSLLEQDYRVMIVRVAEQLRAVAADKADGRLLGVEPGFPLLEIDRIAYSLDQQPIEWRVSRCDSRFLHYAVENT
jgi:GntR family transcriptional regulator